MTPDINFPTLCWSKVSFYSQNLSLQLFFLFLQTCLLFIEGEVNWNLLSLAYKEGCWGRTYLKGRHLLKPWFHYYNVVIEHSKLVIIIHPQLSHLIWETFDLLNALATLCTTKYICFPYKLVQMNALKILSKLIVEMLNYFLLRYNLMR